MGATVVNAMVHRGTLTLVGVRVYLVRSLSFARRGKYHPGQNKYSYKYQINSKTIDPHQIRILRILLIPKQQIRMKITDVTDITDFYRVENHG